MRNWLRVLDFVLCGVLVLILRQAGVFSAGVSTALLGVLLVLATLTGILAARRKSTVAEEAERP